MKAQDAQSGCRPRVLMIVPQPFLEWRGSPLRINVNIRALAGLGFDVDLLVMPFGETPPDLPAGIRVYRPPNRFGRKSIPIGPSAWKAVYDLLLIREARRLLSCNDYAALHGVEEAGAIAGWLGARQGIPVIFEKHSDPDAYRKRGLRNLVMTAYARVERYAIHHAAAVIATGPGLAEDVRKLAPGKPVFHIFDIPSSLAEANPVEVARLRAQFAPRLDDRVAAYAGSFAVYQGIDLMFEAITRVLSAHPPARFMIIGGTQAEIAAIRERYGFDERVVFVGRVPPEQLPNYLGAADICLSPRRAGRNTPLKILDYLKAAHPVVAVESESNRLILNETIARLTRPDSEAFATAILDLLRDDAAREHMGRAARLHVDRHFSLSTFTRRLADCYAAISVRPQRRTM